MTYAASARARIEAVTPPELASAQHATLVAATNSLVQLGDSLRGAVEVNAPADEAGLNAVYFEVDGTRSSSGSVMRATTCSLSRKARASRSTISAPASPAPNLTSCTLDTSSNG